MNRWRWFGKGLSVMAVAMSPLIVSACAATAGGASQIHASQVTQKARLERLILFPGLGAGEGGWCLVPASAGGAVCPTASLPAFEGPFQGPIIIEAWSGGQSYTSNGKNSSSKIERKAMILATSEVAAVSLEGRSPVATHAESGLPDDLRAAIIELRGGSSGQVHELGVTFSKPLPFPRSRFVALNSQGAAIPQSHAPGSPLTFHVSSRHWGRSQHAPRGVCGLEAKGIAGLIFEGGGVMTAVRPHPDVRGREFVDCAEATYMLGNWPLEAGVLLDAARPGSAPTALPVMRPLARHPGVFQGPGAEGETVARRIPGAWLVVAKGEDFRQRLTLLEHLRATVEL